MENSTLLSRTSKFFEIRGYTVESGLSCEGFSGLFYRFDLLVKKGGEEHAVFVMDWNKTVGIDTIIKADKAAEDVDIANPILVARSFSDHVKAYSNKRRITLMTEKDLLPKPEEKT